MFSSRSWQCKMSGLWGTNELSAAKLTAPPHELKCTRVQGALLNLRQKTDMHLHPSFLHWRRTKPGKAHIMRSAPRRSEHPVTVLPADQSLKVKTMLRPELLHTGQAQHVKTFTTAHVVLKSEGTRHALVLQSKGVSSVSTGCDCDFLWVKAGPLCHCSSIVAWQDGTEDV